MPGGQIKKRPFDVGTSYFPHRRTRKYHRIGTLSLLCSEWEEVGHVRIKHRHQKVVRNDACVIAHLLFLEYISNTLLAFGRTRLRASPNVSSVFIVKSALGWLAGLLVLLG